MKMWTNHFRLGFASLLTVAIYSATIARAEQADRTKEIKIEYDVITIDQSKRFYTLEGNVVLTQGTMRFAAERMVITEDDAGFQTAQAFGGPNGQIMFKQKREGSADYMEGFADRAEFDDKADTLKLLSRARLKSGRDELTGEYIYYNSATEVMQARNTIPDAKGSTNAGSGVSRPTITIQPKTLDDKSKRPAPDKTK